VCAIFITHRCCTLPVLLSLLLYPLTSQVSVRLCGWNGWFALSSFKSRPYEAGFGTNIPSNANMQSLSSILSMLQKEGLYNGIHLEGLRWLSILLSTNQFDKGARCISCWLLFVYLVKVRVTCAEIKHFGP
jgi:hypothetical protein